MLQFQNQPFSVFRAKALGWFNDQLVVIGPGTTWYTSDTIDSGFGNWCYKNHVSANGDADGDGKSNLQEYLQGTNPQVPDKSPAPVINANGIEWSFALDRLAAGFQVNFQTSSNLVDWVASRTVTGADFNQQRIRIPIRLPCQARGFVRMIAAPAN
jgi:hypothetical protein